MTRVSSVDGTSDARPIVRLRFITAPREPNHGNAGCGIVVYRADQLTQLWFGLYNPMGTNNSAELSALFHALRMADGYSRAAQAAGGLINRRNGCGGTILEVSLRILRRIIQRGDTEFAIFPK